MARIALLTNPISGRGGGASMAERVAAALEEAAHDCRTIFTRLEPVEQWLIPELSEIDVVVVVGGDGAVRMVSDAVRHTGTPIYHVPVGTENLFAREWGSDTNPRTLLDALKRFEVVHADLAAANGQTFALMASVGLDADVVHDLSERRNGPISHISYVGPCLRQVAEWKPRELSIQVDDRTVIDGYPGCVIIGNCKQYGTRLDPALHADMTDGLLDVVFLPASHSLQMAAWVLACRCRMHVGRRGVRYERGRHVRITSREPFLFQIDGDQPRPHEAVDTLDIHVMPHCLSILVP